MKDFSFLKKNRIPFGYKYGEGKENDKKGEKKKSIPVWIDFKGGKTHG